MNRELKRKWVAALRSGEYKQTTDTLKGPTEEGDTGFCCMGVLLDISGYGEWQGSLYVIPDDGYPMVLDGELSTAAEEMVGMDGVTQTKLIHMNDGVTHPEAVRRHTFAEIADFIEENL